MNSKVVGLHVAEQNNQVPAGNLKPGTLVTIQHHDQIGLITNNDHPDTVDLISLTDPSYSWSHLPTGQGPAVTPLPAGSQVILEAL